jgi:glyoxylase-like metal-dependent hydrolase (beta-lactamase superfamily II)
VEVQEIATGLWRWTAWHEEWKEDVGCVYYETGSRVCLIDPLVPASDADRFWAALDRDVARAVGVDVLITVFWHARSARTVVARYGAELWAPSRARAAVERRAGTVTRPFRPGDELPGGVRAFASGRSTEVLYWLPEHQTLVPGDVLLGDGHGGLRLCPESWLPSGVHHAQLREALRPLLELDVRRVLVSHGEPVLAGGHRELVRALEP